MTSGPKKSAVKDIPSWRQVALKSLWLLLYPAAILSGTIAMASGPSVVERLYSTSVYPVISRTVGAVFSVFPFSFAEFLLYGLIVALICFAATCIVKAFRRKLSIRRFLGWLLTVLIIGGAGFNAFYWMWGFNYYRERLSDRMHLEVRDSSSEELAALCVELAESAKTLRRSVPVDADGIFRYSEGNAGILARIPSAYQMLSGTFPLFDGPVYRPKAVMASEALSYAGISGIFIPFTEEANVNIDDPPLLVGSSAAHEAAHFLGIAREEEANFAAYLACVYSGDTELSYSGTMLALIHAGNALNEADPEAYSTLCASYSEGMRRDLAAYNAYLKAHEGEVSETVTELNDNYLRSHAQASGVRSYGEMVDLLLAYRRYS